MHHFEAGAATLRGDAAHHLGRVLRAEPGQLYELSDGESVWLARTERVGRDSIDFALVEPLPAQASRLRITLLLSIVKFDRFEWALEKAAELGADEIVPLCAERSENGLVSAAVKRATRWERILLESAQQARRLRVPELRTAVLAASAFTNAPDGIRLLLSERDGAAPMREALGTNAAPGDRTTVLPITLAIGPEGGWTVAEISAGAAACFAEVSLGTAILRTETAVCAALAAVQYALGESRATESNNASPAAARPQKRAAKR